MIQLPYNLTLARREFAKIAETFCTEKSIRVEVFRTSPLPDYRVRRSDRPAIRGPRRGNPEPRGVEWEDIRVHAILDSGEGRSRALGEIQKRLTRVARRVDRHLVVSPGTMKGLQDLLPALLEEVVITLHGRAWLGKTTYGSVMRALAPAPILAPNGLLWAFPVSSRGSQTGELGRYLFCEYPFIFDVRRMRLRRPSAVWGFRHAENPDLRLFHCMNMAALHRSFPHASAVPERLREEIAKAVLERQLDQCTAAAS